MMIAFGAAGSSVAAHDIVNVGIARLVAGVVFPMGLMMVVMTGAELFHRRLSGNYGNCTEETYST